MSKSSQKKQDLQRELTHNHISKTNQNTPSSENMNKPQLSKLDITTLGDQSSWSTISMDKNSEGLLFQNAYACPPLATHKIKHVGIMHAHYPFNILRLNQSGTFFLACIEGQGQILIDGVWRSVSANHACLLPPHMVNALRSVKDHTWKFAWVRYSEDENKKAIANSHIPTRGLFNTESVVNVIQGLRDELQQKPHEPVISSWVNLLHQQVIKFARPREIDNRLTLIWNQVADNIAKDWTLFELAGLGFISEEHLRRLNNKQLGRSPMQHLIHLRMMKARELLLKTNKTIESICLEIGYKSPFSFSNTFQKWMGCRPSSLR